MRTLEELSIRPDWENGAKGEEPMRMKHGSDRGPTISVKLRLLAAFAAVAMMFATAVPALLPRTAQAAAEAGICTPQDITMGDNTSNAQEDDGIATWVGRNMYVGAPDGKTSFGKGNAPDKSYAVEAEGLTLVNGKLAINSTKTSWSQKGFRFGIVGFGAQYRPKTGSDTLVVGGNSTDITLTDSDRQSTNVLGWGQLGRGWIGATNSSESEYNAQIAGPESTVLAPVASTTIYLKNTAATPPYIHAWYPDGSDITAWGNRPRMYRVTSEWVAYTFPTTQKINFKFDNGATFSTDGTNLAWTVDNGTRTPGTPSAVKSLYSTSADSVVNWNQNDPLGTVNLNGTPHDYSDNTKTITDLSDTLGAIPAKENAKVTTGLTAPSTREYGYVRNKYNSDKKNDDGTAVHIGVKMTFNDSNYKEKMIVFDGGSQNQNSTIVFDVNATDLNSTGANGLVFWFKNIKEGASVVINVKGNQAVEFHNGWRFWWNDKEISNGYVWNADADVKKAYEQASQAIMWNFQNTPKLTIHGGVLTSGQALRWANKTNEDAGGQHIAGTTSDVEVTVQDDPAAAMIGSILVPRGSFEDHVTTNGRVWVGQDFMMYNPKFAVNFPNGIGEGDSSSVIDMDQERHNFPWKGSMRSECSTISWTKVDESGNTLPGSTWGVYKNTIDAVIEQNALYPAVKDNDIPSGDWNPDEGKFRVDSLVPDATYYIKELTAPQGYVKSDNIYAIHTTNTGSISNKDIIAVYDGDGHEIRDEAEWGIKNDVPGADGGTVPGVINKPQGGSVQWGKYADGDSSHTGLAGSVWTLTKTGEDGWSKEITDNTKAVESVQLFDGENNVTSGSLEVAEGSTLNLTSKVFPTDATQDVTWSSSHPNDVEVQGGHVTVLHVPADGLPVVITATTVDTNASGDRLEAHVALTVKPVELSSLTLQYNGQTAPASISTTVGNTISLTATADPAVLNNSITWSSDNDSIATVNDKGVVTAVKAGTTRIWAKCKEDESKWKSVEIVVNEAVDPNATVIYFNPSSLNLGNATPFIRYQVDGSSWIGDAVEMKQYCDGWYSYAVPSQKKKVSFYFTKSKNQGEVLYQAENKSNFVANANVSDVTVYAYNNTKQGEKPPCNTRSAMAPQSASVADAEDAASLQTFRKARLQTRENTTGTPVYTDSNSKIGQFTILNLPAGDYTLQEQTAPSGYLLNTTVYKFTIGADGKVTWTGDAKPAIVGDMGWISDKPTQVVWDKVDSDNNNALLAGSGWTIEQKSIVDGRETWTIINEVLDCTQSPCNASVKYKDEDPTPGKFLVKKLPRGEYRISETTVPDGYETPKEANGDPVYHPFEITQDGEETVLVSPKPLGNTRKKGKVYWGKVSSEDDTRFLAGSAWKVTYIPYGKTEADKVEVDITDCVQSDGSSTGTCSAADATKAPWAYDANTDEGRIGFDNLPWGSYEMIETKAPDGYYADPDVSYVFSVDPDTPDNQFQNLVIYKKDTATGTTTPLPNYPNQVISNEPGVVLPATGGEGNTLIVLFGFALIAISMVGCGVVMRKRI